MTASTFTIRVRHHMDNASRVRSESANKDHPTPMRPNPMDLISSNRMSRETCDAWIITYTPVER